MGKARKEGKLACSLTAGLGLKYRRSETCMAVEMMFSLAYLYRMYGVNHYADMVERPAFNAFPAAISPDCEIRSFPVIVTETERPGC